MNEKGGVIGIDPGMEGGIAYLWRDVSLTFAMPIRGKEIDIAALRTFVMQNKPDLVVIEAQQSMPKQGVTSTFTIGRNYGMLLGFLATLGVPHQIVKPQEWKKAVLAGTAKDKQAAIDYVSRRYPDVELLIGKRTRPHDGIADAVCIAEYGRLKA